MNESKRPELKVVTNLQTLFKQENVFASNTFFAFLLSAGLVSFDSKKYDDKDVFSEFLEKVWEIKLLGDDLLIDYKGERLFDNEYFKFKFPIIIKNYKTMLPEAIYKKYLNIPG